VKQIEFIPLDKLQPSRISMRPTTDQASLEDLITSISKVGLLHPIIVNFIDGKYEIVSGTRRVMACDALKIPTIPAYVITASIEDAQIIRLHENLFREELNPVDEASALNILERDYHLSREKIASLMGKSKGWVTQRLDIFNWPPDLINALKLKSISFSVAREISRIADQVDLKRLLQLCIESGATVRVVTGWVAEALAKQPAKPEKIIPEIDPDYMNYLKAIFEGPCYTCADDHPEKIHIIGVCPTCLDALKSINKEPAPTDPTI